MKRDYIKRLVSTATSIVMIFSCLVGMITVSAETQYTVSDTISATLSDNGVLTITGIGEIPDYNATSKPWNSVATNITSVVINSGITSIGNMSFTNCRNITSISVAETVKSLGSAAFGNCNNTNLVIDIKGTITTCQSNTFQGVTGKVNVYNQATYDLLKLRGVKNLVLNVDTDSLKADLQKLITETREKYKQKDYTEASYKTLSDALTKAETLVNQASPSTEEIQNATKAINDAVKNLVTVVEGLKTELQSAIDEARKIVTPTYTTSSVAALNKAISDAESVVKKADATEEDVNNALKALETASKVDETGLAETGLKVKASLEGLSRRDKAISTAKQSGEGYTADSYANYKKVYDKLYDLINKSDDITDAQIDSIITELEAAEKLLIEEKIELNLKEYESVKKEIEDILNNDNSSYTKNSLESLKNIYDFQKSMIEDETGKIKDGVLQRRIDTVVDILKRSIDLIDSSCVLVEKGDLTNLKALVESVKDLTESNYTEETWTALSDELTNANALIKDPNNAGKPDVEASEVALKNAIDALSYKSADYKAVDDALAKVPSDLSKYTDETVKKLKEAINAVDKNKNITEQADVDAFAKAIEDAIKALKEKSAGTLQQSPNSQKPSSGITAPKATSRKSVAVKVANKAKIKNLKASGKAKKLTIKWKKIRKVSGYQVQVSTKKTFKNKIVNKKSVKKNKITIKNKKIKKGKTYFVRVRAYVNYKDAKRSTKKVTGSWKKFKVKIR